MNQIAPDAAPPGAGEQAAPVVSLPPAPLRPDGRLADLLRPFTGKPPRARAGTPWADRLASYIDHRGPDECWPWMGTRDPCGYGSFAHTTVHRVVYEQLVGPIPKGLELDHLCHNAAEDCEAGAACLHRRCVNPAHMEPVTHRENTLRGRTGPAKHAAATHCPHGHPYEGSNLRLRPDGRRRCRTCMRVANRLRKVRLRRGAA